MNTPLQEFAERAWKLALPMELKDAGYRKFPVPFDHPYAQSAWQKKFKQGLFLNIYVYATPENHPSEEKYGFQPEAQIRSERRTVNITLLPGNESLEEIEKFFLEMAEYLEAKYGELEN